MHSTKELRDQQNAGAPAENPIRGPVGLIGGIQKFSTEDGPGIRTTVFLKGCPLACQWCHNPELIDPRIQLMVSPSKCIGCRACVSVCARDAISATYAGDDWPSGTLSIDRFIAIRCNSANHPRLKLHSIF